MNLAYPAIRNVIVILCDTLTRDKLSPYHHGEGPYGYIRTPNLQRLAERGITFTNHWINSAPCMPARRDLCSGRIEFPWRSWGPRESFDPDWTLVLRDTDVTTCLFTDHANLFDVPPRWHHRFDLVVEVNNLQSLTTDLRQEAAIALANLLTPHGRLLVICRAAETPAEFVDGPPWPPTESELLEATALAGLVPDSPLSSFSDDEDPAVLQLRAVFRRA